MKKTIAILSAAVLLVSGLPLSACKKPTEPNHGEHGRKPSVPAGITLNDVPQDEYRTVASEFNKKCNYEYLLFPPNFIQTLNNIFAPTALTKQS